MGDNPLDELLEKLCSGDAQAAEQVFVAYEPYLRLVVRRLLPARLRSKFDSLDVVHSVWADLLDGFRNAGWRFTDAGHLRAFLTKATRNRFLDHVRHHQRALDQERPLETMELDQVLTRAEERPSEMAQADDLWDEILRLCQPEHRPLLMLKRRGLSIQEIAAETGYHPSSVRRILYNLARDLAATRKQGPDQDRGG